MSANRMLFSTFFKRNYAMLAAVFGAGFVFEMYICLCVSEDRRALLIGRRRGFNSTMDRFWDNYNRGRQWKDIRSRYVEQDEEEGI
ncbi:hypothetical protein CP532_4758 [Ophiocordyceps camponoti-leonardi (nom. inval.)]|nr:hypothetical protein CP532_4758 [Ophiocordyceps camponoti-leonardi (nom. inval.)]